MSTWVIFGMIVLSCYLVQIIFGLRQMKHFNEVYQQLRKKGRVVIGKRSGKVQSGTIILFGLKKDNTIFETQKMQGISILARFKEMPQFNGIEITALSAHHPLVSKETRLTRQTICHAVELYEKIQEKDYVEVTPESPFGRLKNEVSLFFWKRSQKIKLKNLEERK